VLTGSGSSACAVYGATGFIQQLTQSGQQWTVYNNSTCTMTFYNQSVSATGQQFFLNGLSTLTLPASSPNAYATFINQAINGTQYWVLLSTNCAQALIGQTAGTATPSGFIGETIASTFTTTVSSGLYSTVFDATSLSLSKGNWFVTLTMKQYSGTNVYTQIGISTTSGNSTAGLTTGVNFFTNATNSTQNMQMIAPNVPFLLSSASTIYAKMLISNGSSTAVTVTGNLIAYRFS
jgi:hypothetical protein